jgi:hypothetical protein
MACSLKPVVDSPDFEAATGANITLAMNDHIGTVLISKAEYAGKQIVPAGTAVATITFGVAGGSNRLALVFVFYAGTARVSEVREE